MNTQQRVTTPADHFAGAGKVMQPEQATKNRPRPPLIVPRALTAVLALACLTGCATTAITLPEGRQAPQPVPVQIVVYSENAELQRACRKADNVAEYMTGRDVIACAISSPTEGCLIVVRTITDMHALGHELLHCVWNPRTRAGNAEGIPRHFYSQHLEGKP